MKAAREAGKILMDHYGRSHVKYKNDRSLVTEADEKAEDTIKAILKEEFPDYSFLGEESGMEERTSDYTWVVDPLDGTTNYTIKNPFFCTSIGLTFKGEPVLGVVYNPLAQELFTGEKGKGAYLNGERLKVSRKDKVKDSVVAFCHKRTGESIRRIGKIFVDIKMVTNRLRQLGSGNLECCYVASGRIEAYLMPDVNAWDVVAGAVIVKEAGGLATDFKNKPYNLESGDILVSNGKVHGELLGLVGE